MARIILRAMLWALLGAVAVPIAGLVPLIGAYMRDSHCGAPGDSGGCEMGIASVTIMLVPVGFVVFFTATLVRGILRRRRAVAAP